MSKPALKAALLVAVAAVVGQPAQVQGQQEFPATPSGSQAVRELAFDKDQALAGWAITGDVALDNTTVTLGGPVKAVPKPRPTAPRVIGPELWTPSNQKIPIYTQHRPPATPKLGELPLKQSVSEYGITWTFDQPARVGQFINGDWYVVGPVTIKAISPKPLHGEEIPEMELDHMDLDRPVGQRVRNGLMLNPPAAMRVSYDSGVRNWFDPSLIQRLPVAMKPGDSLVSTISLPKGLVLKPMLWEAVERGVEDRYAHPDRSRAYLRSRATLPRRLPPGLLRSAGQNLPLPQPEARDPPHHSRCRTAGHRIVCPVHATALGGDGLFRTKSASFGKAGVPISTKGTRTFTRRQYWAIAACCKFPHGGDRGEMAGRVARTPSAIFYANRPLTPPHCQARSLPEGLARDLAPRQYQSPGRPIGPTNDVATS